jgi:hypothetical protein
MSSCHLLPPLPGVHNPIAILIAFYDLVATVATKKELRLIFSGVAALLPPLLPPPLVAALRSARTVKSVMTEPPIEVLA